MSKYDRIAERAIRLIGEEWEKQGHNLSGKFIDSGMEYEVKETADEVTITIHDVTERGYGKILDDGVQASQIKYPYARARIQGLTQYAMARMGLDIKTATGVAYAIATKHAQEGMPLPGTVRFSSTGKRTKFVADALAEIEKIIEEEVTKRIEQEVFA